MPSSNSTRTLFPGGVVFRWHLSSPFAGVGARFAVRSRQTQHALGDDVALNYGGAPEDGGPTDLQVGERRMHDAFSRLWPSSCVQALPQASSEGSKMLRQLARCKLKRKTPPVHAVGRCRSARRRARKPRTRPALRFRRSRVCRERRIIATWPAAALFDRVSAATHLCGLALQTLVGQQRVGDPPAVVDGPTTLASGTRT